MYNVGNISTQDRDGLSEVLYPNSCASIQRQCPGLLFSNRYIQSSITGSLQDRISFYACVGSVNMLRMSTVDMFVVSQCS